MPSRGDPGRVIYIGVEAKRVIIRKRLPKKPKVNLDFGSVVGEGLEGAISSSEFIIQRR